MRFGSEEFYQYVIRYISDPSSNELYETLDKLIARDARKIIMQQLNFSSGSITFTEHDLQDIVQEVQLSVFQGLVPFLHGYQKFSEVERYVWFKNVVVRRCRDFLRYKYRVSRGELPFEEDQQAAYTPELPVVDDFSGELLPGLISYVCGLNTSPEKILAFLHSKIILFLLSSRKSSGLPGVAAQELQGKKLEEVAGIVKARLFQLLAIEPGSKIYEGLDKKLAQKVQGVEQKEVLFQLSSQSISDSSYWVTVKMQKDKSIILRMGEDERTHNS